MCAPLTRSDIQSYAPDHLIRPELIAPRAGIELITQHFQYALQRPVMFESILALSYSNLTIMSQVRRGADRRAMYHYGEAVGLIRRTIASGYTGDAVLFSIMSIMGVNYLWNDLPAFGSNLNGLRQVIALRGGLDKLAWPALLKASILSLESFWTYLSHQSHLLGHNTLPAIVANELQPFQGEIDAIMATLPPGFRVLAQAGSLSTNLLPIIQREARFDASLSRASPSSFAHHDGIRKFAHLRTRNGSEVTLASSLQTCEELARLLTNPDLMPLDIVCCIGLFINCLCVARSEQLSPIYFIQLQHHAKQLMAFDLSDDEAAARDLITWTIFNVASTMVPGRLVFRPDMYKDDIRLSLTIKVAAHFATSTWEDMRSILRQFICSDICLDAFENVWSTGIQHAH